MCIYIYLYICIHTWFYTHVKKQVYTHAHVYIYIHTFFVDAEICVGVLQNVNSYICTRACKHTCICMYAHANKNHVYQERCINVYVFNVM